LRMDFCAQNRFNFDFRIERLFRNPIKGHDRRPRDRIESGNKQGVMDDEGAAQAREWF